MKTVLVAMSGGVDSSTAAALLKEQGYCVIGMFFRLHDYFKKSEEKALKVSEKLGIELCILDFRKEFKAKVVDYFIAANKKGLTPNPCVLCNKVVKFDLLFNNLKNYRADYLATGHYVRLKNGKLLRGKDEQKDQSYFLWKLDKKILQKALFPVGDYTKKEIREIAKRFDLPVWDEPESQEICFVNTELEEFLKKNLKTQKGKVVDEADNVLAGHEGLWLYTVGQRKRIGLSGGPYYVLKKDLKKNILVVTKNKKNLFKKNLRFREANWIQNKPKFPLSTEAKIRSSHQPARAVIDKSGYLVFKEPQLAPTPGQSVAFYKKSEMLGGGVIWG